MPSEAASLAARETAAPAAEQPTAVEGERTDAEQPAVAVSVQLPVTEEGGETAAEQPAAAEQPVPAGAEDVFAVWLRAQNSRVLIQLRDSVERLRAKNAGIADLRACVAESARLQTMVGPRQLPSRERLESYGVPVTELEQARRLLVLLSACDKIEEQAQGHLERNQMGLAAIDDLERLLRAWDDLVELLNSFGALPGPPPAAASVDIGMVPRAIRLGVLCSSMKWQLSQLEGELQKKAASKTATEEQTSEYQAFETRIRRFERQACIQRAMESLEALSIPASSKKTGVVEARVQAFEQLVSANATKPPPETRTQKLVALGETCDKLEEQLQGHLERNQMGLAAMDDLERLVRVWDELVQFVKRPNEDAGMVERAIRLGVLCKSMKLQLSQLVDHLRKAAESEAGTEEDRCDFDTFENRIRRLEEDECVQRAMASMEALAAPGPPPDALSKRTEEEEAEVIFMPAGGFFEKGLDISLVEEDPADLEAKRKKKKERRKAMLREAKQDAKEVAALVKFRTESIVKTNLTSPSQAASRILTVAPSRGFKVGQRLRVNPDGRTEEEATLEVVGANETLMLAEPLRFTHYIGEDVAVVQTTAVEPESLPWAVIAAGGGNAILEISKRECDGKSRDAQQCSILWHAVASGNDGLARYMLDNFPPGTETGVEITEVHPPEANTLLHMLCRRRPFYPVAELFNRIVRAAPDSLLAAVNASGESILGLAAARTNLEVFTFLLAERAEVAFKLAMDQRAPLRRLAENLGRPPLPRRPPSKATAIPAYFSLVGLLGSAAGAVPFADVSLEAGPGLATSREEASGEQKCGRFLAHRAILAAQSPVLSQKFQESAASARSGGTVDQAVTQVRVDRRISLHVWRAVLQFLYTGEIACDCEGKPVWLTELLLACVLYRLPAPLLDYAQAGLFQTAAAWPPAASAEVLRMCSGDVPQPDLRQSLDPLGDLAAYVILTQATALAEGMDRGKAMELVSAALARMADITAKRQAAAMDAAVSFAPSPATGAWSAVGLRAASAAALADAGKSLGFGDLRQAPPMLTGGWSLLTGTG